MTTNKKSTRQLKKLARKFYPNAKKTELGSNGGTNGIWVEEKNATCRIFISCIKNSFC